MDVLNQMRSVLILTGLWTVQSRLFGNPVPRSKIKFLGSGLRHSGENFHAVISAENIKAVKNLKVTYSDCGSSVACESAQPFLTNIPLNNTNVRVTAKMKGETELKDGDFVVYDVEYNYTESILRNHLLTVFSDGLGEESIICATGQEINMGGLEGNACKGCLSGSTYAKFYDATCMNCTQTCQSGKRVSAACTESTDTDCSESCTTITCANNHYVSEACDRGSASEPSTTAGVCSSCVDAEQCEGEIYFSKPCEKGNTYVEGSKAVCSAMTNPNPTDKITHYLNKTGEVGTIDKKGTDNQWAVCTSPGDNEWVSATCGVGVGQNTVIKACSVCADDHRVETTACTPGDKNTEGKDAECGGCLEGFTLDAGSCVSRSYMFGYVYMKPDGGQSCGKHCVKWSGQLNDNFANQKIKGTPSADICDLLSEREPLLYSSECGRT